MEVSVNIRYNENADIYLWKKHFWGEKTKTKYKSVSSKSKIKRIMSDSALVIFVCLLQPVLKVFGEKPAHYYYF